MPAEAEIEVRLLRAQEPRDGSDRQRWGREGTDCPPHPGRRGDRPRDTSTPDFQPPGGETTRLCQRLSLVPYGGRGSVAGPVHGDSGRRARTTGCLGGGGGAFLSACPFYNLRMENR